MKLYLLIITIIFSCTNNDHNSKKQISKKLIPITTQSPQAKVLFEEARFFTQNGIEGDLMATYAKAIELDPSFVRMHNFISIYARDDSVKLKSHNLAKKYKHLSSKEEQMLVEATEYRFQHPEDLSESKLFELSTMCPDDKYLHHTICFLLFRKNPKKAIEAGKKSVAVDPTYGSGYNILGYAYMNDQQYIKAELAFDNYIKYTPNNANPLDSKADLMLKQEKYMEALALKKKAYDMDTSLYWIPEELISIQEKINVKNKRR